MNATSAVKPLEQRVNLLRHKKVVHAYGTRNLGEQTLTVNGVTVMQHPFTCIVAGCETRTVCGALVYFVSNSTASSVEFCIS